MKILTWACSKFILACDRVGIPVPVRSKDIAIMAQSNPRHRGKYPQHIYVIIEGQGAQQYTIVEN